MTTAGVLFLIGSVLLTINLWPSHSSSSSNNNKTTEAVTQQVLGESTTETTPAPDSQFTQYTVKNGDTLFNISQQYNVRWDSIAQINDLSEPFVVHAGQILKIPQATTSKVDGKIYTIKSNDTLSSIAKQFNITVADIIAVNPNLQKSDLITPGQVIKLP